MVFNDTSGRDAIIQNCESLSNLGDAGITGNTVLMAKFTSFVNQAMDKVATAMLMVDKNWRWDDTSSYGDFPIGTTDLEDGVRSYVLPRATDAADQSTLWKVYKVRLMDTNGVWYELDPLASDEDENNADTQGRPTHYRLLGNSIRLSVIPNTGDITMTAGMQVWYQRAFTRFTTSDTTKQPPFISGYHYLLQLDASASYLLPTNTKLAISYIQLFNDGVDKLKNSIALRNDDPKVTRRLRPHIEDTE